jgi:hypothetical protein
MQRKSRYAACENLSGSRTFAYRTSSCRTKLASRAHLKPGFMAGISCRCSHRYGIITRKNGTVQRPRSGQIDQFAVNGFCGPYVHI